MVQSPLGRTRHYSVILDGFPEEVAHDLDIVVKLTASHEVLM